VVRNAEKVYKKRIKDIDELRARILTVTAWDEMDQRIIDAAITSGAHVFVNTLKRKADTLNTH